MFKTGPLVQAQFDHSNIASDLGNRETRRGEVAIAADIRAFGGKKNKVKVIDISQTGFRMECLTLIPNNQVIFLTLPSFGQMEAQIAWHTEWMYGCKFVHPLHLAIYEHIVRAHPSLAVKPTSSTTGMMGTDASLQWRRAFE